MLLFLLLGIVAGAATGVPIGPVNVAVIDAAYRHTIRRAIATGLGGAVADMLYAGLAVLGIAPILQSNPSVPPIMYGFSGIVLLVYGFMTARSQPVQTAVVETPPGETTSQKSENRREVRQGFSVGIALILLNPAAIVSWVVIVDQLLPATETVLEGVGFALGVCLGSFGWFTLVAYLTLKGKNVLGDKTAWIPRFIGIGLMGYAIWLLTRAMAYIA